MSAGMDLVYERVGYRYASHGAHALRAVSLAIAPGERVVLAGSNGAGKTTLLLLATGLIAPSEGAVSVRGTQVSPRTVREVRTQVSLVFADPDDQLFCASALDEVAFGPRQQGLAQAECDALARAQLARVGLSGYEAREPLSLSLGEKKRLAIAASLATRAPVLLLDEPTSGLDPRARRQLLAVLAELPGTIVMATHDLDAALALSARVVVLANGAIVADGPAERVLHDGALLEANGLELPLSVSRRP